MTQPVADIKSGQIQAHHEVSSIADSDGLPPLAQHTETIPPHSVPSVHTRHGILPAFQSLLNLIVIAIFIITFCAQPFRIPSESME